MAHRIDMPRGVPSNGELEKSIQLDTERVKLVQFRMPAGSRIPAHTNPGVVQITVLEGEADLLAGEETRRHGVGSFIVYEPGEKHGMEAVQDCVLLATIIK